MKEVLFNGNDIVLFVIIYVCVLFSLIMLVARRDQGRAHVWLGLFLLSQAALSIQILALWGEHFHERVALNFPWAFALLETSIWLEGPLLLLYTRSVLYRHFRYSRVDIFLVLPLFIYLIIVVGVKIFYEAESGSEFLLFLRSDHIQYYEHLRNLFRVLFGAWAYWEMRKYQQRAHNAYSNLDGLYFSWLKLLVVGFILLRIWFSSYVSLYTFVASLGGDASVEQIDFDLFGLMSNYGQLFLISLLLYFGVSDARNTSRVSKETLDDVVSAADGNAPAYTKEQIVRLQQHMEKASPYLDSQLKIEDLASQVSIHAKLLSSLINREFKMNFFEFVNSYRLKEVKMLLANSELSEESIIDLAFRAGYNSKTSFNRLFKQDTGQTPSEYRKDVLVKDA